MCHAVLSDLRDLTATIARCRWLLDLDADPEAVDRQLTVGPVARPAGDQGARPSGAAHRRRRRARGAGRARPAGLDGRGPDPRGSIGPCPRRAGGRPRRGPDPPVPDARSVGVSRPTSGDADGRDAPRSAHSWGHPTRATSTSVRERPGRDDGGPRRDCGRGPWTRQVIAMRALGDPDAFPVGGPRCSPAAERLGLAPRAALVARSRGWRPWRAYAVQYLWSVDDHRINDWPPTPSRESRRTKGNP